MLSRVKTARLLKWHNYYNHFTARWTVSGTTRVSEYQKGKTNLDLMEQETYTYTHLFYGPFDFDQDYPGE